MSSKISPCSPECCSFFIFLGIGTTGAQAHRTIVTLQFLLFNFYSNVCYLQWAVIIGAAHWYWIWSWWCWLVMSLGIGIVLLSVFFAAQRWQPFNGHAYQLVPRNGISVFLIFYAMFNQSVSMHSIVKYSQKGSELLETLKSSPPASV